MGTESTVLIVGRGKRVLWDCASDGLLGWGFAALAASVASYGLDSLRQSLDELAVCMGGTVVRAASGGLCFAYVAWR